MIKAFELPKGFRELIGTGQDVMAINDALEQQGTEPQLCLRKPEHVPGHLWYSLRDDAKRWLSRAEAVIEDSGALVRAPCRLSGASERMQFETGWAEPRSETCPRSAFA